VPKCPNPGQIEGHSSGGEKLKHPKIVIGFRVSESYNDFKSFYQYLGAEWALRFSESRTVG